MEGHPQGKAASEQSKAQAYKMSAIDCTNQPDNLYNLFPTTTKASSALVAGVQASTRDPVVEAT